MRSLRCKRLSSSTGFFTNCQFFQAHSAYITPAITSCTDGNSVELCFRFFLISIHFPVTGAFECPRPVLDKAFDIIRGDNRETGQSHGGIHGIDAGAATALRAAAAGSLPDNVPWQESPPLSDWQDLSPAVSAGTYRLARAHSSAAAAKVGYRAAEAVCWQSGFVL